MSVYIYIYIYVFVSFALVLAKSPPVGKEGVQPELLGLAAYRKPNRG